MSLHVHGFAVDVPLIDDRHDHGVTRFVLGDLRSGGPSSRTRRARPRRHRHRRVDGDHIATARLAVSSSWRRRAWKPVEQGFLARRDERSRHFPEIHVASVRSELRQPTASCASSARPSGSTRSRLTCGRAMTWVAMTSPTFSPPRRRRRRGLHGRDVAADDRGDVAAAGLLVARRARPWLPSPSRQQLRPSPRSSGIRSSPVRLPFVPPVSFLNRFYESSRPSRPSSAPTAACQPTSTSCSSPPR